MVTQFCSGVQSEAWADDVDTIRFTTDWEDDFDAVGIAKCCQCGLRLPVDHDTIEQHSRTCSRRFNSRSNSRAISSEVPHVELPRSAKSMTQETDACARVRKPAALTNAWSKALLSRPLQLPNADAETTCYSSGLEEESGVSWSDDVAHPCMSYDQVTDLDESTSHLQDMSRIEDWEDGFDAIGIGKCSHCGSKLPLDDAAIEQHLRECKARAADAAGDPSPEYGTCCRCGKRISMDPEAVIAHSQRCLAQAVLPPPRKKKQGPQPVSDAAAPGTPLALSAGCFDANSSLFGSSASGSGNHVLNRCMHDKAEEGNDQEYASSILSSWASWKTPWASRSL